MSCPGAPKCNGHGACLSMLQLAEQTTDNGDATAFTYGTRPNYFKTWDFNKVFGCKCDSGFTGYDCSLRTSDNKARRCGLLKYSCSKGGYQRSRSH